MTTQDSIDDILSSQFPDAKEMSVEELKQKSDQIAEAEAEKKQSEKI